MTLNLRFRFSSYPHRSQYRSIPHDTTLASPTLPLFCGRRQSQRLPAVSAATAWGSQLVLSPSLSRKLRTSVAVRSNSTFLAAPRERLRQSESNTYQRKGCALLRHPLCEIDRLRYCTCFSSFSSSSSFPSCYYPFSFTTISTVLVSTTTTTYHILEPCLHRTTAVTTLTFLRGTPAPILRAVVPTFRTRKPLASTPRSTTPFQSCATTSTRVSFTTRFRPSSRRTRPLLTKLLFSLHFARSLNDNANHYSQRAWRKS